MHKVPIYLDTACGSFKESFSKVMAEEELDIILDL
jgi:hypothetical protein